MFREISRNKKQELSEERDLEILSKATSGVLSVLGEDGYPYGVPMSYAIKGKELYFHGMPRGHKMEAISSYSNVSFTVIETDQIIPEEYTTYYRSVIVFGKAEIVEDLDEKRKALFCLVEKYSQDFIKGSSKEIEEKLKSVGVFKVIMEHISGKEAIEFADGK